MSIENINTETCIGCGICIATCPMDVLRLDTIAEKKVCSPCSLGCPLGVNQREYHHLIKLDMLDEAAEILGKSHPMPAITGRICPHPCESDCTRNEIDTAVNINGLEQYLGDYLLNITPTAPKPIYKARVAVIGSGPAGLSAAYYLCIKGYEVTVYEKDSRPGGLLRSAVPAFRLPEEVIEKQIAYYEQIGITFMCGVNFGHDITREELEKEGYKAFIAAVGADKPLGLQVPGSDAEGIVSSVTFLRQVKSGEIKNISGKVAVIGGGSVAVDAARSAIRLGADEVNLVCLECTEPGLKDSMLAIKEEIDDAVSEGVNIHPSRGVDSFTVIDGKVTGIKCVECLSVRNEEGKLNPVYGDCVLPLEIMADKVVMAIGQTIDPLLVPEGYKTDRNGFIVADGKTGYAALNLFAAGDSVSGSSTVVEALASGRRAALSIDNFLKGKDLTADLNKNPSQFEGKYHKKIDVQDRIDTQKISPEKGKNTWEETTIPFNWDDARNESERCLTCGSQARITFVNDCQICRLCSVYCPVDAVTISAQKCFPPMLGWG